MARGEGRRTDEERRRLLAEHEASGLSVAQFARERGLSAWTLYDWRRRLREGDRVARREEPTFVQVRVRSERPLPMAMTVEIGAPLLVQVPLGFDEAELRRLIGVLASC